MTFNVVEVPEKIKSLLIVGEKVDDTFSYETFDIQSIILAIMYGVVSIYSFIQGITISTVWYLLMLTFMLASLYYGLQSRVTFMYLVTQYRIILVENNLTGKIFFRDSKLIGFRDLHYEHVESIKIAPPEIKISTLFISIFSISIGWAMLSTITINNQGLVLYNFLRLISILLILSASLAIILNLPYGGVKLTVRSISGTEMYFPKKHTPELFLNKLLINCRTLLSYMGED